MLHAQVHIITRPQQGNYYKFCYRDRNTNKYNFLYEFRPGLSVRHYHNINIAFGNDTVNERTIYRWFERSRFGDHGLTSKEHCRPANETL